MSTAHLKVNLKPDDVIKSLMDEFECLIIEDTQLKASEKALAAAGRGGKKGRKFHDNKDNAVKSDHVKVECWNCGKKGDI